MTLHKGQMSSWHYVSAGYCVTCVVPGTRGVLLPGVNFAPGYRRCTAKYEGNRGGYKSLYLATSSDLF